jgi:hypothetical protein
VFAAILCLNSEALAEEPSGLQAIDLSQVQLDPGTSAPPPANFSEAADGSKPGAGEADGDGANVNGDSGANPQPIMVSAQDEARLGRIEQKAFGSVYSEHEAEDRLEHLEKEIFGKKMTGSLEERLAKLENKLFGSTAFGGAPNVPSVGGSRPLVAARPPQGSAVPPAGTYPPTNTFPQGSAYPPSSAFPQANRTGTYPSANTFPKGGAYPPASAFPQANRPGTYPPANTFPQGSAYPPSSAFPQANRPGTYPSANTFPKGGAYPPASAFPPVGQPGYPFPGANANNNAYPNQTALPSVRGGLGLDAGVVASSLSYDSKAGDYLYLIRRFPALGGNQFYLARWRQFPLKIKLPQGSPESWQRALESVVARWDQYVPVKMALASENVDVEVLWVNKLPPRCLGVSRLNIVQGRQKVWIYLLRPSFYPPQIAERQLSTVFAREVGHSLGLWGASDRSQDLMYQVPAKDPTQLPKNASVSNRDINTLKRILEGPVVPEGPGSLTLERPLEWATTY